MAQGELPLTLGMLEEYNDRVLFPHLQEEFASRKDIEVWKDAIVTSNDQLVKKLDQILTEQQAIT